MISIITDIGCIVVVLILMIPPILFGYAMCAMKDNLFKFTTILLVIEVAVLTSGLIYYVNGGLF